MSHRKKRPEALCLDLKDNSLVKLCLGWKAQVYENNFLRRGKSFEVGSRFRTGEPFEAMLPPQSSTASVRKSPSSGP